MTENPTGEKIGKCMPPIEAGKDTRFKKGVVPPVTNEQKRAGRQRKKNAMKMMDLVLEYQDYTIDRLNDIMNDPSTPMLELLMCRYVIGGAKDNKMLIDFMDRHVPKAPTQMAIGGDEDNQTPINIQDYSKYSPEELAAMIKKFTTK